MIDYTILNSAKNSSYFNRSHEISHDNNEYFKNHEKNLYECLLFPTRIKYLD